MKLKTRILVGFSFIVIVPMMVLAIFLTASNRQQGPVQAEQGESLLISMPDTSYDIVIEPPKKESSSRDILRKAWLVTGISLILCSTLVGLWLYWSIAVPLKELKEAAGNIRDGNLDFTLEGRGEDEFSELIQDFDQMRSHLKESAEEKVLADQANTELISNISHDLRTPLTTIEGYIEGILDGVASTPEKMERYARTISRKAKEMERLINQLALYSKIGSNQMTYQMETLSVYDYFGQVAVEVLMELETQGITMTYENQVPEEVCIIADPEQLQRVIDNIVSNSIKYQDPDKDVHLLQMRVREVGDFIQVEMEDNGKGISEENLRSIFDRFYRTDASRNSSTGGSGIGLSIVRKIIEDHGGRAWAGSREGVGTVIYFALRRSSKEAYPPHRGRETWVDIPMEPHFIRDPEGERGQNGHPNRVDR